MRYVLFGIAMLICVAGGLASSQSAQTDQPAGLLPHVTSDAMSKASKEAFELLIAPRAAPADLTIKIVGDQHHWSYTYTNPPGPAFKGSANAETANQPDIDSDIVVPQGKSVELIVTANDKVYELAIPVLGLAMTAVPGRIQTLDIETTKAGRFTSVCGTGCSADEQADPITLRVVSQGDYDNWLQRRKDRKP